MMNTPSILPVCWVLALPAPLPLRSRRDMVVQRKTASRYLDKIVAMGLLEKVKLGTSNYYVNAPLVALLSRVNVPENGKTGT